MKTILKNSKIYPFLAPAYHGAKQLVHAPQMLTNILFPKTIALLYHRVNTLPDDPYELSVSPKNFEAHIFYLKEHFTILSLQDIEQSIKNKKTIHRGILLTFDDGYLDNLSYAFPILKKYGVPAVIFVSGIAEDRTEFWWDELSRIFSKKENLPKNFSIVINDVQFNFQADTTQSREKTRNDLHALIKPLCYSHREEVLEQLFEICKLQRMLRPEYARCGKDEILSLANSGLVSIGGHTARHTQLSSLTPEEQEKEIKENFCYLTENCGLKNVKALAYPYGTKNDYARETIKIVKKYYSLAFSNFRGHIYAHTNPYEIPRSVVKNWTQEEFAKKIHAFYTQ